MASIYKQYDLLKQYITLCEDIKQKYRKYEEEGELTQDPYLTAKHSIQKTAKKVQKLSEKMDVLWMLRYADLDFGRAELSCSRMEDILCKEVKRFEKSKKRSWVAEEKIVKEAVIFLEETFAYKRNEGNKQKLEEAAYKKKRIAYLANKSKQHTVRNVIFTTCFVTVIGGCTLVRSNINNEVYQEAVEESKEEIRNFPQKVIKQIETLFGKETQQEKPKSYVKK